MTKALVQNALWLELSPSYEEKNFLAHCHALNTCQMAMDDFLAEKLSWTDYLDICQYYGLNVDDYRQTVQENLIVIQNARSSPLSL